MKNKILALTLVLIMALSSTSVLAADQMYNTNFNIYDMFRNFGYFYNEPDYSNDYAQADTYNKKVPVNNGAVTTQAPSNERATTRTKATAAPSTSNYERKVAELVNVERQKNGLAPLTFDSSISNVARIKSKDMSDNNYFAHQSPNYGSAADMLTQNGIRYSSWGENIAKGQRTPEEVVRAWMNSPGHRANILGSHFNKIGVGYVNNESPYWTQMFTN
jgi:uncharacterized YkwD family protein